MNFSLRLAILRSPHRTQVRLASVTRIPESRLSRIVHGWTTPRTTERTALAQALGVSEDALFPVEATDSSH